MTELKYMKHIRKILNTKTIENQQKEMHKYTNTHIVNRSRVIPPV